MEKSINKLIKKDDSTFEEVVELLDQNGLGILPIVDEENSLLGIVTDGDIRRAILHKDISLSSVINFKPTVVKNNINRHEIIAHLKRIKRRHMPVVDEQGKLVDIVMLDDFQIDYHPNTVVLMAGGLGSRLGDLTRDIPKPMLKVGGEPILESIVKDFKRQGFNKFIFCVNYKADIIFDYFGNGEQHGVEIVYTKETKRMGTAGALSLINKNDIAHPFLVVNADVITSLDFNNLLDFHLDNEAYGTMCVKREGYQIPYACIETDDLNNLVSLQEKPTYNYLVNTGIYSLSPTVLDFISPDEYLDMPDLFKQLSHSNKSIKVFEANGYWRDIGRPNDFDQANEDMQIGEKEK